jgi:hypothetical protein
MSDLGPVNARAGGGTAFVPGHATWTGRHSGLRAPAEPVHVPVLREAFVLVGKSPFRRRDRAGRGGGADAALIGAEGSGVWADATAAPCRT